MKPFMSSYNSQGYALMRIVVGFLFLWHGAQKLFGIPSAMLGEISALSSGHSAPRFNSTY